MEDNKTSEEKPMIAEIIKIIKSQESSSFYGSHLNYLRESDYDLVAEEIEKQITAPMQSEIDGLKKEVERLTQTERIHALSYAVNLYPEQDQYIHIAKKAFMAGENNAFYVLRKENRLKF